MTLCETIMSRCDCFDEKNVFHINNKSCMEYQTELMKLLLEVAALYF